ncbi:hypothetical protein K458DRAFT_381330 [Lentithecium fluviatile CBS 122367]|uniref:Zn(2)-C6 fungal-type domain-containing protein n=1 Tax=Lentithecium fluviatile CBS 122367 TaxID=1168545 RepID=A0A6G1JMX3_9PLEO|nr:hypothetical protein K458DRAFT_381330 [Lentithecium fluviatile CBS 122367]
MKDAIIRIHPPVMTACWRCVLRSERCDIERLPCTNCRTAYENGSEERLRCESQTRLTEDVEAAFNTATQIGQSNWILREDQDAFKLTIDYSELAPPLLEAHAVRDVLDFRRIESELNEARLCFLAQFITISSRWGGLYERMTENTLTHAARYQALLYSTEPESPLTEKEQWVILNALRCLLNTRNVEEITGYLGTRDNLAAISSETEPILSATLVRHLRGNWSAHPTIYVTESSGNEPHFFESSETFASLLTSTLSGTQSLLLRGRPKDWPTVFYVLYVLTLVHSDLFNCRGYTTAFDEVRRVIKESLKSLSVIFLSCCSESGLQPFSSRFDKTRYALMLGVDTAHMSVQHYDRHRTLWVKEDRPDEIDDEANEDQFMRILYEYSFGFMCF